MHNIALKKIILITIVLLSVTIFVLATYVIVVGRETPHLVTVKLIDCVNSINICNFKTEKYGYNHILLIGSETPLSKDFTCNITIKDKNNILLINNNYNIESLETSNWLQNNNLKSYILKSKIEDFNNLTVDSYFTIEVEFPNNLLNKNISIWLAYLKKSKYF